MKSLSVLSLLFVLVTPVLAGGAFQGYRCDNECPLAQAANSHRALGVEARATSKVVQADLVARVETNLARV